MSGISQNKSIEDFSLKSLTLTEVNRVLLRIGALVSQSHGIGQNVNVHGSRIVLVGDAVQTGDAVNKTSLDSGLASKANIPSSSSDNAIIRGDGITGLQGSLAIIDDSGTINIPALETYNIGGVPHSHALDDLSDVIVSSVERGDLVFFNGTNWVNLHHGTDLQVLRTRGHGADPDWGGVPVPGSATEVLINVAGEVGSDPGFTYDKTTDLAIIDHSLLITSDNPLYSYTEPKIILRDTSGIAGQKAIQFYYNSGPEVGNVGVGAIVLQDIGDDFSYVKQIAGLWKDLSVHWGGITRPSAAGNFKISSGALEVVGYNVETDKQLKSTAISGPPLSVASTEMVANFNSNTVGGYAATGLCLSTGWTSSTYTWVYVSPTSYKIVGANATAIFVPGTKVRLVQSSAWKYFYVVSSAFSTDTTVTVTGGSDFSIADSTITQPSYSYSCPPDFPVWFNHAEEWDGFSTAPSGGVSRFKVEGRRVIWNLFRSTVGTSDANNCTATLPITAKTLTGYLVGFKGMATEGASVYDDGSRGYIVTGGTIATFCRANSPTGWATSGNKNFVGLILYEI